MVIDMLVPVGIPVVVTLKVPAVLTVKVVLFALVITGGAKNPFRTVS